MRITSTQRGPWTVTIQGDDNTQFNLLDDFVNRGHRPMLFTISQIIVKHRANGYVHTIYMIKDIRAATGLGLKDAKDFVEAITKSGMGMGMVAEA